MTDLLTNIGWRQKNLDYQHPSKIMTGHLYFFWYVNLYVCISETIMNDVTNWISSELLNGLSNNDLCRAISKITVLMDPDGDSNLPRLLVSPFFDNIVSLLNFLLLYPCLNCTNLLPLESFLTKEYFRGRQYFCHVITVCNISNDLNEFVIDLVVELLHFVANFIGDSKYSLY